MKYLSILILVAVLVIGVLSCVATSPPPERYPPLPPEIGVLREMFGEPEYFPGVAMTLVWNLREINLHVLLVYDPFSGWIFDGYEMESTETVPSELQAVMYEAWRKHRDDEIPRDPWGNPITDQRVLQPEIR